MNERQRLVKLKTEIKKEINDLLSERKPDELSESEQGLLEVMLDDAVVVGRDLEDLEKLQQEKQ